MFEPSALIRLKGGFENITTGWMYIIGRRLDSGDRSLTVVT